MTPIDLSDYTLGELKGLLFDVEREVRRRRQQEVTEARERIHAIARETGVAPDALLRSARPRSEG
jgi:DNA-binding protein H-NS